MFGVLKNSLLGKDWSSVQGKPLSNEPLLIGQTSYNVAVIGKTGVGKSSLIICTMVNVSLKQVLGSLSHQMAFICLSINFLICPSIFLTLGDWRLVKKTSGCVN